MAPLTPKIVTVTGWPRREPKAWLGWKGAAGLIIIALAAGIYVGRSISDQQRVNPRELLPLVLSIQSWAEVANKSASMNTVQRLRTAVGQPNVARGVTGVSPQDSVSQLLNTLVLQALEDSITFANVAAGAESLGKRLHAASVPPPFTNPAFWEALDGFAWPFVVVFGVFVLVLWRAAPYRLERILAPLSMIRLGTAEISLHNENQHFRIEQVFNHYRTERKNEFDRRARADRLAEKLSDVVRNSIQPAVDRINGKHTPIRATIHVPDVLFTDTLYQLLDYQPKGSGRGRTFTTRFGIIGKTWRYGESLIEPSIPTKDPDQLVLQYGMTWTEADDAGKNKQAFACVLLANENSDPVGVLYMDSDRPYAFGKDSRDSEFCRAIAAACQKRGIPAALTRIVESVSQNAPFLDANG